uniref:Uncharacterized protein n=1 Tax=Anopheles dirus TaxID=7168 RepID=A0A182N0I1_9DIPT
MAENEPVETSGEAGWRQLMLRWVKCMVPDNAPFNMDGFYELYRQKVIAVHKQEERTVAEFLRAKFPSFELQLGERGEIPEHDYVYAFSLMLYFACVRHPVPSIQSICQTFDEHEQHQIKRFLNAFVEEAPSTTAAINRAFLDRAMLNAKPPAAAGGMSAVQMLSSTPKAAAKRPSPQTPKVVTLEWRVKHLTAQLETLRSENMNQEMYIERLTNTAHELRNDAQRHLAKIGALQLMVATHECGDTETRESADHAELEHVRKQLVEKDGCIEMLREEIGQVKERLSEESQRHVMLTQNYARQKKCVETLEHATQVLQEEIAEKALINQQQTETINELQRFIHENRLNKAGPVESPECSFELLDRSTGDSRDWENLGSSVVDVKLKEKEQENEAMRCTIRDLEQQLVTLEGKLAHSRSRADKKAAINRLITELEQKIDDACEERHASLMLMEEMAAQCKQAVEEARLEKLREKDVVTREIKQLEAKLADEEQSKEFLLDNIRTVEAMEEGHRLEIVTLKQQLDEADNKCTTLENDLANKLWLHEKNVSDEIQQLQVKLADEKQSKELLLDNIRTVEAVEEGHRLEIITLKQQLDEAGNKCTALENDLANKRWLYVENVATQEMKQLEGKLADEKQSKELLLDDIRSLEAVEIGHRLEIIALKQQMDEARDKCAILEETNTRWLHEMDVASQEIKQLEEKLDDEKQSKERLLEYVQSMEEKKESLRFQITTLNQQMEEAHNKWAMMEEELANKIYLHEKNGVSEIQQLEAKLTDEKHSKERLLEDIRAMEEVDEGLRFEISTLKRQMDEAHSKCAMLEEELGNKRCLDEKKVVSDEIQQLVAKLADEKQSKESMLEDIQAMEEVEEGLRLEITTLQQQMDESHNKCAVLEADLANILCHHEKNVPDEVQQLEAKLADEKQSKERLLEDVQAMEAVEKGLRLDISALKQQVDEAHNKCAMLEEDIASKRWLHEKEVVSQEIKQLEAKLADEKQSKEHLLEDMRAMEAVEEGHRLEIITLKQQLDEAGNKCTALENDLANKRWLHEKNVVSQEIKQLEAKLTDEKQSKEHLLEDMRAMEAVEEGLRLEITTLKQQMGEAGDKCATLEADLANKRWLHEKNVSDEIQQLAAKLADEKQSKERLLDDLRMLAAAKEAHCLEIATLSQQLEEEREKSAELNDQCVQAQRKGSDLEAQCTALLNALAEKDRLLAEQLEEAGKKVAEYEKCCYDCQILSVKLYKARREVADTKAAAEKARDALSKLVEESKQTLEKTLREARVEFDSTMEKMKDRMKELHRETKTKLESENQGLKRAADVYGKKIETLETRCAMLQKQVAEMNERDLAARKENQLLHTKLKTLEEHASERKSMLLPAQANLREYRPSTAGDVCARALTPSFPLPAGRNLKMEDEEGELFNNMYLADLKSGRCGSPESSSGRLDRYSELSSRNSLRLPHLRTNYTALAPDCEPPLDDTRDNTSTSTFDDSATGLITRRKVGGITSYKRPGPPTPSKRAGRLSLGGAFSANGNEIQYKEALRDANANAAAAAGGEGPTSQHQHQQQQQQQRVARTKTPGKFKQMISSSSLLGNFQRDEGTARVANGRDAGARVRTHREHRFDANRSLLLVGAGPAEPLGAIAEGPEAAAPTDPTPLSAVPLLSTAAWATAPTLKPPLGTPLTVSDYSFQRPFGSNRHKLLYQQYASRANRQRLFDQAREDTTAGGPGSS